MSDTPRTDAASWSFVDADFARQLERDLAQRTAERDEARREYCKARYREERVDLRSTPTQPQVIAANRGWDCFDAKEGER
jgi:hypothetical protein